MKNREDGFYWATFNSLQAGVLGLSEVETRVIAEYCKGNWYVTGCQFESESNISNISDTRITVIFNK